MRYNALILKQGYKMPHELEASAVDRFIQLYQNQFEDVVVGFSTSELTTIVLPLQPTPKGHTLPTEEYTSPEVWKEAFDALVEAKQLVHNYDNRYVLVGDSLYEALIALPKVRKAKEEGYFSLKPSELYTYCRKELIESLRHLPTYTPNNDGTFELDIIKLRTVFTQGDDKQRFFAYKISTIPDILTYLGGAIHHQDETLNTYTITDQEICATLQAHTEFNRNGGPKPEVEIPASPPFTDHLLQAIQQGLVLFGDQGPKF
jgi:hypothetical protein